MSLARAGAPAAMALDGKGTVRPGMAGAVGPSLLVAGVGCWIRRIKNMNYGHLIKRPFEIVARRPYLWLLGFLAGGATASNFSSGGTNYTQSGTYSGPSWTAIQNAWNGNWEWIVGILAFFVV